MEGQGDSCRVEPLEERGSNSAVGFDMWLTLQIRSGDNRQRSQVTNKPRLLHLDVIRLNDCQRVLRWLLLAPREFLALSQP